MTTPEATAAVELLKNRVRGTSGNVTDIANTLRSVGEVVAWLAERELEADKRKAAAKMEKVGAV